MGFLKKMMSSKPPTSGINVAAMTLPSDALLSVVGESFYQDALEATAQSAVIGKPPLPIDCVFLDDAGELPWFTGILVREPDNEYDENAIAVWSPQGKIGHLSRDDADSYQDVLIEIERQGSQAAACSAFLRRASNGMWGAVLTVSDADACLIDVQS